MVLRQHAKRGHGDVVVLFSFAFVVVEFLDQQPHEFLRRGRRVLQRKGVERFFTGKKTTTEG